MRRDPLERLTIRAALILGFGLILGLWVFTGYAFSRRLADMEADTSQVTRRYMAAQDLLSVVRQQVSSNSIVLRNALLDPSPSAQAGYASRLHEGHTLISATLDSYMPVFESPETSASIGRLRAEINEFRYLTLQVLAAHQGSGSVSPWDLLSKSITPRRATVIALSEEIRALNRKALVQHQTATAGIHRAMERQWWWRQGVALAANIAIALLAIIYAGRLEDRLRRQRDRDAENHRDLQLLSARLVAAQEEERRTIARELHDEVGQVLSAIKVELLLAERALDAPGGARQVLDDLQTMTDGALTTVRDLSQLLRPAVLDDLGLAPAVDGLLRGLARRHHVQVELVQQGSSERLAVDTEVAAFRIVQEALTNVARHANATRCTVHLVSRPHTLSILIEDDGQGFDPGALETRGARRGLGLIGLRERVAERGGSIAIDSAPGRGTRVVVDLPAVVLVRSAEMDEATSPLLDSALNGPWVSHG